MLSEINWDRLEQWIPLLEQIHEDSFTMAYYRSVWSDTGDAICRTSGCILGHMTAYAQNPIPKGDYNNINFEQFSGTELGIVFGTYLWEYLFAERWQKVDNTLQGAIDRIKYACSNRMDPMSDLWKTLCPFPIKTSNEELINTGVGITD